VVLVLATVEQITGAFLAVLEMEPLVELVELAQAVEVLTLV
jgi:hypothetical protein